MRDIFKYLTVIIPAKKEKESIYQFLSEVIKLNCQTIVILKKNDIETINEIKKIKYKKLKIIFQKKVGFGNAIAEGLKKIDTKYFCLMMADGSQNPSEVKPMLDEIINSKFDFIFGSRYIQNKSGSDDDTLITFIGNKLFSILGKLFFNIKLSDILYTFVIGNTLKVNNLKLSQEDFRICVELPIKVQINKYLYKSYPCYERKRYGGIKKVNAFKDGSLILIYMIKSFFKIR